MSSPVNLAVIRTARSVLTDIAGRLWPGHCLACGEAADSGDLCPICRHALPRNRCACARCGLPLAAPAEACADCLRRPPPLTATVAAFRYEAPFTRLLPRFKFHGDLAAGRVCSREMAAIVGEATRPDALIPIPLHGARLRRRGFDQALELAKPLARTLDLPLRTDLLHRVHDTAPQSRLDAPARRRNLRRAFAVDARALARGLPAHVALIDDVMTTGATLHAAAHALLRAGVLRVDAWVCARVG